jgi:hypothetical protein
MYNYIRAISAAALENRAYLSEMQTIEIAEYLSREEALWFQYKSDCAKPYFDLLGNSGTALSNEARGKISSYLASVSWIRKEQITNPIFSGKA